VVDHAVDWSAAKANFKVVSGMRSGDGDGDAAQMWMWGQADVDVGTEASFGV
jgi:hypothetical protein